MQTDRIDQRSVDIEDCSLGHGEFPPDEKQRAMSHDTARKAHTMNRGLIPGGCSLLHRSSRSSMLGRLPGLRLSSNSFCQFIKSNQEHHNGAGYIFFSPLADLSATWLQTVTEASEMFAATAQVVEHRTALSP